MESIQDFTSLVAACAVAMIILQVLCYVMKKIRNFTVQVLDWHTAQPRERNLVERAAMTARNRKERRIDQKKQPVEHDEPRIDWVSRPFYYIYFNTKFLLL